MEAATVKECLNIINFKTLKYIRSKEHAEKTTHLSVLPCSMVVKDKRDSKGELLLWKSRLCTGGHRTDPTTYQPFDKTSPTASMDAVYMVLIFAQHMRMNIEVCDVPSTYLNTPLPKGKKHLMRIKPLLTRKVFHQSGQLRQGIPASGRIYVGSTREGTLWAPRSRQIVA